MFACRWLYKRKLLIGFGTLSFIELSLISLHILVMGHLVIFASFVEGVIAKCIFKGLLYIENGKICKIKKL